MGKQLVQLQPVRSKHVAFFLTFFYQQKSGFERKWLKEQLDICFFFQFFVICIINAQFLIWLTVYFCGWWAISCYLACQLSFKFSHCEFSLLSKDKEEGCNCQKNVFLYNTKVLCKKGTPGHCCLLSCVCFSTLESNILIILLALLWKSAEVLSFPTWIWKGNAFKECTESP